MNIHIDLMASKYSVDKLFHASISSEDEISITNIPCRRNKIVKKKSRITDINKPQSEYAVLLNPKSELVKGAIVELSCKVELIQTRISKVEGRIKEKGEPLTCSKKKLEMFLLEFLTNELKKTQKRLVDLKRVISPDLPLKEDLNDNLSSCKELHIIEEESSDSLDVGNNNEDIIDRNKMNEYDRESKVRQITCRIKEEVKKIRASAEKHRYIHVDNKERHDEMINDDVLSHNQSVKIEDERDISEKFESHSFMETQNSISPAPKLDSPHESYKCLQCHKKFVRLYHYRYHMATHEKSAYQCSKCQRSYETVERLQKHVRLHSLKRPHECLECKKSFVTITGLNVHKRLHTGERPYKCTMCHKTFRQQSHLKTHLKSRHLKEKTRQCQRCKKMFDNKAEFLSHIRKECSVKRHYTCPKCKIAFNKKKTVLKHMSHGCD